MLRFVLPFAVLLCSACLWAGESQRHAIAFDRTETQAAATIAIVSPAFADGRAIPLRYAAYGDGVSPPLEWSGVPGDAAGLLLMVEDPDASSHRPFLHWVVWNIPASARGLPENVGPEGMPGAPESMTQGQNHRGKAGYFGPHPPGSKPHRYVFQLFALDRMLDLDPDAKRDNIIAAMEGRVLAKGRLLGLFTKPG